MTEGDGRFIRIGIAAALMVALVFIAGGLLHEVSTSGAIVANGGQLDTLIGQEGQFSTFAAPPVLEWGEEARTLQQKRSLRAFDGAPPHVPHPVVEDMKRIESCLSCHRYGGYTPRFSAYAPPTPHPELTSCQQCHVTQDEVTVFRPTLFVGREMKWRDESVPPGSPPPMSHDLHMREHCVVCHSGPAAPAELRTDHPERPGCLQCHALPSAASPWVRRTEDDS